MIITQPQDFALFSALYRSSVDGRRYMYEAILSDDGLYDLPDYFTSRTAEILQVYMKSLGVKMETVYDPAVEILTPESYTTTVSYHVGNQIILCTIAEQYYLKKMHKVLKKYFKLHPGQLYNTEDIIDYIMENLPFKKKFLTDNIMKLFKDNILVFSI